MKATRHIGAALVSISLAVSAGFSRAEVAPAPGRLDPGFVPQGLGPNSSVVKILVQGDNKILIVEQYSRTPLRRLNVDGSADTAFALPTVTAVTPYETVGALALQGERILIGGRLTNMNGTAVHGIARLNTDGTLDPTFNTSTRFETFFTGNPMGSIYTLAVGPEGKIYVGGQFHTVNGTANAHVARLNVDGTHDPTFQSPIWQGGASSVSRLLIEPNSIIVAGGYSFKPPIFRAGSLARLFLDGTIDTSFESPAFYLSGNVAVEPDHGKYVLMSEYSTTQLGALVRLLSSGVVDRSFSGPQINERLFEVKVQSDSKVIIGGNFTQIDSKARKYLARVNADGHLDETFSTPALDNLVVALAFHPPNGILIGGYFKSVDEAPRPGLARLIGGEPPPAPPRFTEPPQSLVVTAGDNAHFTAKAAGHPLFYSWYKDGRSIPGATNVTLTVWNVQSGDAGQYQLIVSNSLGQATSPLVDLQVAPLPLVTNLILNPSFEQAAPTVPRPQRFGSFLFGITNWTFGSTADLFRFPLDIPANYQGEQMVLHGTNYLGFVRVVLPPSEADIFVPGGGVTGQLAQATAPNGRYELEAWFSLAELSALPATEVELLLADAQGATLPLGRETITNRLGWQRYHRTLITSRPYDRVIIPRRLDLAGFFHLQNYLYVDKLSLVAVPPVPPVFAGGSNRRYELAPLSSFFLTNTVIGTDVTDGALSFQLDPGALGGFTIDPRTGVVGGMADLKEAGTTNRLVITAVYNQSPLLTSTSVVQIVVGPALRVALGGTRVRAGTDGSVPITLDVYAAPGTGLTNIQFELEYPPKRLTNITFAPLLPDLGECTTARTAEGRIAINCATRQSLTGRQTLGEIRFTAVSPQRSGFFALSVRNGVGTANDGEEIGVAFSEAGRLGIIGREALVDTAVISGARFFRVYGVSGGRYRLESTPFVPNSGPWREVGELVLTNGAAEFTLIDTNVSAAFFRVRELP